MKKNDLAWEELDPVAPFYLFVPHDKESWAAYAEGESVTEIFSVSSVGLVTARDKLVIHFAKKNLRHVIHDFSKLDSEVARRKYGLGKDVRDWRVKWAQADLVESGLDESRLVQCLYRPFDQRWTYFTGKSRGFMCMPRGEVMRNMLHTNIALVTSRLTKGETFKHVQVTDTIAEVICMSPKTSNNGFLFPLYLYDEQGAKSENLTASFRSFIDERYENHYEPEEILGYVYAVLHAPIYRDTYAEFLRIDFPRIPFPENSADFEALSELGWDLMRKHLLRDVPVLGVGSYQGKGGDEVEKPRYVEAEQSLYINDAQKFAQLPPEVWSFHIGGYQVLAKYLKDRKGRKLTLDEINNVENVANVLAFTIEQMEKIDEAYRKAFPDVG